MTSVGKQTVVYQDRVTALSDVSLSRELGVPVGIENDEVTGGKRVVYHQDGQTTFDWKTAPETTVALPGSWANVDGRLGVVMAAGSGLSYQQAAGYDPHTAVCADVLYGSFSDHPRHFKAGEQVAQRIVLFFVEVTPKTTAALSRSSALTKSRAPRCSISNCPKAERPKCLCSDPASHCAPFTGPGRNQTGELAAPRPFSCNKGGFP